MRNRQSVLWWILGIYLIFSVTSTTLGQAVPSETDTASNDSGSDKASDDSVLSQSQIAKIMDEIHQVEIRLSAHIDEKYSKLKIESDALRKVEIGLRNHIDQRYLEHNTKILTLNEVEDRLRAHIDQKYSEHNTKILTLNEVEDRLRAHIDQKYSEHNSKIDKLNNNVIELEIIGNVLEVPLIIIAGGIIALVIIALTKWILHSWSLRHLPGKNQFRDPSLPDSG